MKTTWVVVAHRAGARIFEHKTPGKGLQLVQELQHAAGRLRSSEIDADRPGRAFDRAGQGRHALSTEESAHEHAAAAFARELAERLHSGRTDNRFGQLVLVAEPRFLGLLRGALDGVSASMVAGTVSKDLAHLQARELLPHLQTVLLV
jgi:protein required for attachment to host cells